MDGQIGAHLRALIASSVQVLEDRSSARRNNRQITPQQIELMVQLRRTLRESAVDIGQRMGLSHSTVSKYLRQHGLSKPKDLDGSAKDKPPRYQREHPGELLHLDIKKLARIEQVGHRIHGDRRQHARGAGWAYVHVAIDDASRLAYAEVLSNEKGDTASGFLRRALR